MSKQKRKLAATAKKQAAVEKVASQVHIKPGRRPVSPVPSVDTSDIDDDSEEDVPPPKPFRFFDLPAELRLRIYKIVLGVNDTIDLSESLIRLNILCQLTNCPDPINYRLIAPRLALLLVSRRMHEETYRIFYRQAIRLFPTNGRFFHTKKPLLSRLPTRYRRMINTLELRLGPGWTAPPRGQKTNPELGLADCTSCRRLRIFVECDPSESVFAGFRGKNATEDTYKFFCVNLLLGILDQVPSIATVEVDAYPSVKKDAALIMALRRRIEEHGKELIWGPLRGWDKENDEPGLVALENLLAGMDISDTPRLITAQA